MTPRRILIVGGVAGGMSAAARARRLSEDAHIVVFERGPYVSFANCGLPYHLGGEIADREDLLVQTPQALKAKLNLDVRVRSEVVRVDRELREVEVRDLQSGRTYREAYDALVLSPGASPIRPPIPGIDLPGVFTVRSVPDVDAINAWIREHNARRAVIVGGGFVGLEMAEQLVCRGLHVSLVEALPQVMNALDPEMASYLHAELRASGVDLHLGDSVERFDEEQRSAGAGEQGGSSPAPLLPRSSAALHSVVLRSGARLPADLIILGVGVRPEVTLARDAGLEIGALGGIRVNERLQTSDPAIWAVGDAIEVKHAVTGQSSLIPLAGPANRQGRLAADAIFGRDVRYEGTLGTGIVRVFGLAAAGTGASEKQLRRAGIEYEVVHLHPLSHAGYFPGAEPIHLKVLFSPKSGFVLGAQAVGRDGVDKRIDVLATAIKAGMTMHELADLELAYAPPFGSARDPVNLAGMIGQNVLNGYVSLAQWHEVESLNPDESVLLDVRQPEEWDAGHIPGAVHIPLPQLRIRLGELPTDKEIVVYCKVGQRSYYASRILTQRGFRCRNLTGAYLTWQAGIKSLPSA